MVFIGARWVPVADAPHFKIPSHQKRRPPQERAGYFLSHLGLPRGAEEALWGGVVDSRGPVLYSDWVKLESLDVGKLPHQVSW